MRYKDGMEFATEEEAEEYFGTPSYGYFTSTGFFQKNVNKQDNFTTISHKNYTVEEPKDFCVMANIESGGVLFVSDSGVTFNMLDAKRFTLSQAKSKAKAMTKRGKYNWMWSLR
jgi:hypothetical protein